MSAFPICLAGLCNAQNVTMALRVGAVGTAVASVFNQGAANTRFATLPVGPIPFGPVLVNSLTRSSGLASSNIEMNPSFSGQVAATGFRIYTEAVAVASGTSSSSAQTTMTAPVRLTLMSPVPVSGRLALRYFGQTSGASAANINVDLGGDGSVDFKALSNSFASSSTPRFIEFPVTMAPSLSIDLSVANQASTAMPGAGSSVAIASMVIEAQFFPGQPAVQTYDLSGATAELLATHHPDDTLDLRLEYESLQPPGVIIFGLQPTSVPLLQTATQLVQTGFVAPGNNLLVALPQLPPGTTVFCQGFIVDGTAALRSSPSLRVLWP